MIIDRYGIRLLKLRHENIDLLRQWRNAEKISRFMEYREHISPAMQQRWFDGLDPVCDMYFMIEYHGQLVGMIHTSNIDIEQGTGDAGLFIYNDELQSTHLPVLASLSMVDVVFGLLGLRKLYAKVMAGNTVAERYNRNLGFEQIAEQTTPGFQTYVLDRDKYWEATDLLHVTAQKIGGPHFKVDMSNAYYERLSTAGMLRNAPNAMFDNVLTITV